MKTRALETLTRLGVPAYELARTQNERPHVFVLSGLPGLGKSILAASLERHSKSAHGEEKCTIKTAEHKTHSVPQNVLTVSTDNVWPLVCPHEFDRVATSSGYALCEALIGAYVLQGYHVVFDSTGLTPRHRALVQNILHERCGSAHNITTSCLWFPVNDDTLTLSIQNRREELDENTIRNMATRWVEPCESEGFDACVQLKPWVPYEKEQRKQ